MTILEGLMMFGLAVLFVATCRIIWCGITNKPFFG